MKGSIEMDEEFLGKVTAFITRRRGAGLDMLVFQHPNAGIQIPAGTMEESETPEQAVLRETREETGLENVRVHAYIGFLDEARPAGEFVVCQNTKVYARPDPTSFDWAEFQRGISVRQLRQDGKFLQVTYEEMDRFPDPEYLTYQITGWVPRSALSSGTRRHFFHLVLDGESPGETWVTYADQHSFRLFWAPVSDLPRIVEPQDRWLGYVQDMGYSFD